MTVRSRLQQRGRRCAMAMVPVLLALPAAASAQSQAQSQSQVQSTRDYLQRMDTDGDGRVSLVEYQAWMSYAFDGMDRDGDGVLSAAEQPGGKGKPLTRQLHRERLSQRFKRQDVNRDGYLNAVELAAPPQ